MLSIFVFNIGSNGYWLNKYDFIGEPDPVHKSVMQIIKKKSFSLPYCLLVQYLCMTHKINHHSISPDIEYHTCELIRRRNKIQIVDDCVVGIHLQYNFGISIHPTPPLTMPISICEEVGNICVTLNDFRACHSDAERSTTLHLVK